MIQLLDQTTIDKIAAGEVIERPSSVVKELLENSIDAGASIITVEIKEGGISFIRVTDNGCGIPKDEVRTAYLRHATSKIVDVKDLDAIGTLGFRGEALATIAAVSQTEMVTKTMEELTGIKYIIHGGKEIELTEVGVPEGTTTIVRNLFFNTPARKKFLKSPMTEASYINDLVQKIALSHPEISFKLIINGQNRINTTGNGNLKDAIYQLFGKDITNALLKVDYKNESISVSGYIGKPYICRGNRGLENYFVNNRYIKSSVCNRAIEEAYKTYVMMHKFPFCVLFLETPPDKLDVNVHPTKMEFKYSDEKLLFETLLNAVKDALEEKELIPPLAKSGNANWQASPVTPKEKVTEPFEKNRSNMIPKPAYNANAYSNSYSILTSLKEADEATKEDQKSVTLSLSGQSSQAKPETDNISAPNDTNHVQMQKLNAYQQSSQIGDDLKNGNINKNESKFREIKGEQLTMFDNKFLSEKARSKHRLIGQLFGTYWIIQYENNMYIMDQHAAHEKVKYEQLMKSFKSREVYSQQLMPPLIVTVTYQERQAILDNFDLFMKIGYDIQEFGGNEFKINAVPSNLYSINERAVFMDFVSSLIENSGYISNDIFVKRLSTMACKSAVKGNTELSFKEADYLVEQLLSLENPYTCPHGRPTIISMSEEEIEKKFRRIV